MNRYRSVLILVLLFSSFCFLIKTNPKKSNQTSDWTFLIYKQPSNNLAKWAFMNINDMALAQNQSNINIFVQICLVKNLAARYQVKNGKIIFQDYVEVGSDNISDIVNSAKWAFGKQKSKHHSIIFWGHGFGILEPHFVENSSTGFNWESDHFMGNEGCSDNFCPLKGILFDDKTQNQITNQQMIEIFKEVKNVLGGKKLDIFGTDCCKMAMIEIGYQIKDSVDYLIGSQNCELADGWDYKGFFSGFSKYLSPLEASKLAVNSYGDYYKQETEKEIYTLSAIDLNFTDELVENMNNVVNLVQDYCKKDSSFWNLVFNARSNSLKICDSPFYTDIDSFYTNLLNEIEKNKDTLSKNKVVIEQIKKALFNGKDIISKMVVANVTGDRKRDAKGVSVYFPYDLIDSSYPKSIFAKNTLWLKFLNNFLSLY